MAHTTYDASSVQSKRLRKAAGVYLKGLRVDQGMTQRELASAVGLDYYTFISQLECGSGRVPPHLYIPFADAFDVDRPEFAKQMLKYYDPFGYQALFGNSPYEMKFSSDKESRGSA